MAPFSEHIPALNRRAFLGQTAAGIGGMALTSLLSSEASATNAPPLGTQG